MKLLEGKHDSRGHELTGPASGGMVRNYFLALQRDLELGIKGWGFMIHFGEEIQEIHWRNEITLEGDGRKML